MKERTAIICMGRYGDIISALPIAMMDFRASGQKPKFCVSKQFASILDGVSYVEPVVWDMDYKHLRFAINRMKDRMPIRVAQCYANPDNRRLTDSYQRESWRIAGVELNLAGTIRPVFDRRDSSREEALAKAHVNGPTILWAGSGVSSPFPQSSRYLSALRDAFPGHAVVDIGSIRAERPYDLLGLMDRSSLLISVDTMHLHLSGASCVPVIAILNNGWYGSVPPPGTVASFRYESVSPEAVVEAARSAIASIPTIYHCVAPFGNDARHQWARSTWTDMVNIEVKEDMLSDLMRHALKPANDSDLILWTNDDIGVDPSIVSSIRTHLGCRDALAIHRNESGHIGRDAFAFRAGWLRSNVDGVPNFYIGFPSFDLVWAAFIRKNYGIQTNYGNLASSIHPAEVPGLRVLHQPHQSHWPTKTSDPRYIHNLRYAKEWCARHMPSLTP